LSDKDEIPHIRRVSLQRSEDLLRRRRLADQAGADRTDSA